MSVCEKLHENGERSFLKISKNLSKCELISQINKNYLRKSSSTSLLCITPKRSNTDQAKEKVLPDIIGWRRAVMEDMPAIRHLQTLTGDIANFIYRKKNIDELLDKSFFPVVQYDSMGDLISFTAYDSYPNIPSLSVFWDDWISLNYRFDDVKPGNVLFIHYMLWKPEQANKFLPLLLKSLFYEFVYVKHIIIIKPPKVIIPDFYRNYFIPLLPSGLNELEYNSVQSILVCLRTTIIHPLFIRSAFEYELDIIMATIKTHLKPEAETNKPHVFDFVNFVYQKDKKTLICEFEGQLAGIMILNLKIDLDVLNDGFELAPFNGLRKKNLLEQEKSEPETPPVSKHSSIKVQEYPNLLISSEFLFSQMNWEIMLSKIKTTNASQICTNESTSSYSSEDEFSEFSLITMSSLIDLNKSEVENKPTLNFGKNDFAHKTGEVNIAIRTSGISMAHFFSSEYHGQSNAFVIDFFAIDCNKINEKLSSFDFLEAAFKKIPDRDYCVLIIPTDFLPFPLLDLFVRVTPRPKSSFKQEMYLCHKKSLLAISMSVRSIEKNDLDDINYFLKHVDEGDTIYRDISNKCFTINNDFKSFILTVEEKIVGVSLINCQDFVEYFRMYFDIADSTPIEWNSTVIGSIIKHLVINPKYNNHARFFLHDIMRLVDANCLFYIYNKSSKAECSITTVLGEFYPIKPKKKAGLDTLFSPVQLPIFEKKDSFGLYFMNPRLCTICKMHMNIVIVVVGASRTSLSFLESLIFGPTNNFILYNNLICVTPHGLEAENEQKNFNLMFPIRDNFSRKYLSMLSLETYVNFIYGVMTGINRSEKYIVVNNKDVVRYDYLILTCGLQYLSPTPKAKETLKNSNKNSRSSLAQFLLRSSGQKKIYTPKHPNNMFLINTSNDAQNAMRTLQDLLGKVKRVRKGDKKIIVYGHDLHVFLTIHTLLKLGIPGDFIVFVEPFPTDMTTVTLFNDYCVDQAVLEMVKEYKVSYYMEYFLYDWSVSSDDYITSITFHSRRKQIIIPCLAFFPFIEKLVSDVTFNACNDAGLVYDKRLVINHNFRTNDSYIYAAGPFTKYAKRYFADEWNHQYYNSTEIGQKLAEIIREKIDPQTRYEDEKTSDLVPQMKAPILLHCQLPGDFNFFTLRKPGKELDMETAFNFVDYGEVLTTGDCQMKKGFGYFRLHLSPEGFVQSITCYTKDKIDYINLSSLYGLHEKFLNNLLLRYDMSLIPDFFDYFCQPWAFALFHKNFQLLRNRNSQSFCQSTSKDENFYNKVVEKLRLNQWKSLSETTKKELESDYLYSTIEDDIKNNLLQFLEYYKQDLQVYAIPSRVEHLRFNRPKS